MMDIAKIGGSYHHDKCTKNRNISDHWALRCFYAFELKLLLTFTYLSELVFLLNSSEPDNGKGPFTNTCKGGPDAKKIVTKIFRGPLQTS